jgi:molecular chaperone Hsp33
MTKPDIVIPFHLEKLPVRGRLVRLDEQMRKIINQHNYLPLVNKYLSEAVALALALANCFKYDGLFTFQINGQGPLQLIVVDITKDGHIRACARYDHKKIDDLPKTDGKSVPIVFGAGHLVFTIEPEDSEERYQGIVELSGATLAECLHHFFRQSEQLETGIIVKSQWPVKDDMVAGALMIQQMPTSQIENSSERERIEDGWVRSLSVLGTLHHNELLDPDLSENVLLYRLFWEDDVQVHQPKKYIAQCRCSRDKIFNMLMSFDTEARQEMIIQSKIDVKCEFCGTTYNFNENDLNM